MSQRLRVWDLPTRLFHWLLAFCVISLVITAYRDETEWHARLGYATLALLLFRLVWGFVGGRWSRFASFVYAPRSVAAYLRGQAHPDHLVGHTPLGAASVFAMLLVLLLQVGTGLFTDDEIFFRGPLNHLVQGSTASLATWYHKAIGQWLVIALVVVHVAAVLFYLLRKRQNLVRPMVTGDKMVDRPVTPSRDDTLTRIAALVLLAVCAGIVVWIVRLGLAAATGAGDSFN